MALHIFQSESELQNIPEAAPKASPSFSVSEKTRSLWFFRIIWRGTPHLACGQGHARGYAIISPNKWPL
jgi:hypothetical protein